jgi:putative oxidoreductase
MPASVSLGLLILRVVAGLTIASHGAQKAFGWFGGPGWAKTMSGYHGRGLKPGWLWAALAIVGEFGGGLALALGFLTPFSAAGMVGAMVMAIVMVHWRNGFFNSNRGVEFPLQILAAAVAIGVAGPGAYSIDALASIHLPAALFPVLAVIAIIVDAIGLYLTSRAAAAQRAQPA